MLNGSFVENHPIASLFLVAATMISSAEIIVHEPSNVDNPKDLPIQYELSVNSQKVMFAQISTTLPEQKLRFFSQDRTLSGFLPASSLSDKEIPCILNQKIKWQSNFIFNDLAWSVGQQSLKCDSLNNQEFVPVDFTPI